MNRANLSKVLVSTKAAVLEFLLFFGIGWTMLEPLGITGSLRLWGTLVAVTLVSALAVDWIRVRVFLLPQARSEKGKPAKAGCCVTGEATNICPLGVKRIYNHTDETIRESMHTTKRKFVWFGLSAFNVVHNNLDVLRDQLHGRELKFYLVSDRLQSALDQHDSRRPNILTPLSSKELLDKGVELIERLNAEIGNRADLHLIRYDQIHTFRIILVDDQQAYISFYEQKSDALRSHQLLLEYSPDVKYPILPWFQEFVERIGNFHSEEQKLGDRRDRESKNS